MGKGSKGYDAIIVGARCAGSPTAMLLARKGYRVLVVDRATLPQRHRVDPRGAAARGRRAGAMGPARPPGGDRLPADRHLRLRFRSFDHRWHARYEGCAGRVLPAADRPGQAAGRRRGRSRGRDPGGLHRGGDPDRRRTGRRHQGPFEGRRHGQRARRGGHRRRRPALAGGQGGPARAVQRKAAAAGRATTLTGAAYRCTGGSRSTSVRTADSPPCRPTTA